MQFILPYYSFCPSLLSLVHFSPCIILFSSRPALLRCPVQADSRDINRSGERRSPRQSRRGPSGRFGTAHRDDRCVSWPEEINFRSNMQVFIKVLQTGQREPTSARVTFHGPQNTCARCAEYQPLCCLRQLYSL